MKYKVIIVDVCPERWRMTLLREPTWYEDIFWIFFKRRFFGGDWVIYEGLESSDRYLNKQTYDNWIEEYAPEIENRSKDFDKEHTEKSIDEAFNAEIIRRFVSEFRWNLKRYNLDSLINETKNKKTKKLGLEFKHALIKNRIYAIRKQREKHAKGVTI